MHDDIQERRFDGGDASRMENLNREIARMTAQWRRDVEDSVELYNLLARARSWIGLLAIKTAPAPMPAREMTIEQDRQLGALLDEIDVALREIPRR